MSAWIDQIFDAQQVNSGNVVRRNINDVNKYASMDELIDEIKKRGYHLVECGDQVLIVCNPGNIRIVV
jgi:hypothetical protein